MSDNWYLRVAPSLGALEAEPNEIWGTKTYDPTLHSNEKAVFFGLYGLPDWYTMWHHKGMRFVLWAGSDILHFRNGYWLNHFEGSTNLKPEPLAEWMSYAVQNWVENEWEYEELKKLGINARIGPSFVGKIESYELSYISSQHPHVYVSCGAQRQLEYGFGIVERIAHHVPEITFHLYGDSWYTKQPNIMVHGRVPKEQMNTEIKTMQAGLRLNKTDGFSEVLAKSVLWGQWPISAMKYNHMAYAPDDESLIKTLKELRYKTEPNIAGRIYYLENLNRYPWTGRM